jgi:hypothetical protein
MLDITDHLLVSRCGSHSMTTTCWLSFWILPYRDSPANSKLGGGCYCTSFDLYFFSRNTRVAMKNLDKQPPLPLVTRNGLVLDNLNYVKLSGH